MQGINLTLIEFSPLSEGDLVVMDDLNLEIGKIKFVGLSEYGRRGHNAVNFLNRSGLTTSRRNSPRIALIGTRDRDLESSQNHERVNLPLRGKKSSLVFLSILFLCRGILLYWPNESLIVQEAYKFQYNVVRKFR